METFELEKKRVFAVYHKNTLDEVHTVFDLAKGGPIVNDSSLDAAKYKFESAIRLGSAVRNLLYFGNVVKVTTSKKVRFPVKNIADVLYQEMVA